ncbi:MAG: DUF4974 domain-containing protein [Bacteroidales bacterium]|nr:DUF4974 domain-containing protein [Bacteroidales bacterium]MDD4671186.1 DUF4974 domain-containing protein [Bacteroidales bacterium]
MKEDIDELIEKILGGTATSKEMAVFTEWITDEENKRYFIEYKQLYHLTAGVHLTEDEQKKALKEYLKYIESPQKYNRILTVKRKIMQYAAILALVLVAGFGIRYLFPQKVVNEYVVYTSFPVDVKEVTLTMASGKLISLSEPDTSIISESGVQLDKVDNMMIVRNPKTGVREVAYNTISVPKGKKFNVVLPDGTKVLLNSESSLHFPLIFKDNNRYVSLKGEAFFDVGKDSTRPFCVKSENMLTTVLGTKFNISSYADDGCEYVTIMEGCVSVKAFDREVTLNKNERLCVNIEDRTIDIAQNEDIADYFLWRDNTLIVDNLTFDQMLKQFERWYSVKFINKSEVKSSERFNGRFNSENVEEAMNTVAVSANIKYTIENKTIIVTSKDVIH